MLHLIKAIGKGKEQFLNLDQVVSVKRLDDGSSLVMADGIKYTAQNTPEELMELMGGPMLLKTNTLDTAENIETKVDAGAEQSPTPPGTQKAAAKTDGKKGGKKGGRGK